MNLFYAVILFGIFFNNSISPAAAAAVKLDESNKQTAEDCQLEACVVQCVPEESKTGYTRPGNYHLNYKYKGIEYAGAGDKNPMLFEAYKNCLRACVIKYKHALESKKKD